MDVTFLPAIINDKPTSTLVKQLAKQEVRMMHVAIKVAMNIYIRCRLAEAQNWKCCWCGCECIEQANKPHSATIEHVLPRSLGGENTWENYAMACGNCNHRRGNMSVEDFIAGKTPPKTRTTAERRQDKRTDKFVDKAHRYNVNGWVRSDGTELCKVMWLNSLCLNARKRKIVEDVVFCDA